MVSCRSVFPAKYLIFMVGAQGPRTLDPLIKSQLLRHTCSERTRSRKHVEENDGFFIAAI